MPGGGAVCGEGAEGKVEAVIQQVLEMKKTDVYSGQATIEALKQRKDAVPVLLKAMSLASRAEQREVIMRVLVECGTVKHETAASFRDHSNLSNEEAVAALVRLLDSSEDVVRSLAMRYLTDYAADDVVRPHGLEIVATISKRQMADTALLLGKTGCAEARRLVGANRTIAPTSDRATTLALTKLGDAQKEELLVREFASANDPRRKAEIARDLGIVATPGAVAALASELRSPLTLAFGGRGEISLRVVIIESLSRALPQNDLFWKPKKTPDADDYYAQIEKWAEDVMRIRWATARPPFLYTIPDAGRPG
jgi:hypothetical protein